ncbi:MAG: hypothetical protein O7G87_07225 [bacterium]|nr:hypothetical protein [bacterium]
MKDATWRSILVVAGILIEVCLIGILLLGDLRQQVPVFCVLFGLATGMYILSIFRCIHLPLWLIVLFGLVFRATLMPMPPSLSDDHFRYVWDGRVQAAGLNPYVHAPDSEVLAHLREEAIYPHINHAELPTIYPPLAQLAFRAGYWISPSIWGIKALLLGFDLLTAWFLVGLIRMYDQHKEQVLIYLWNPLLVLEVAGNSHVDMLGVSFMVFGLVYLSMNGFGRAAGAFALSFLSKYFVICLVPVFWRWICSRGHDDSHLGRALSLFRVKKAWPMGVFFGLVGLGYWLYLDAGDRVIGSLGVYAKDWEFNAPVFDGLRKLTGSGEAARLVILGIFGTAVVGLTLSWLPPIRAGYLLVGLFVLLSPTLHPWYLIWMVPFLVFYRNLAWIVFTSLVVLSYHVVIRYAAEGVWQEAMWVRWVEYGGLAAISGATYVWSRFKARRHEEAH